MAVTTYRQIQDRVLDQLSKNDSITRNRVKNWINMGQSDFVLRELWPFREKTGSFNLTANTQEYSTALTLPDIDERNILSVALQGQVRRKVPYIPFNQLRADRPDFDEDGAGVPRWYYLKAGNLGFFPVPSADYEVAIDYYALPTEMEDDNDQPLLPVNYRESLVHYALSLEHDYNTDPDLAQKSMNRYEDIVTLARQNLLSQPSDTGNFRILGPADSRDWTGLHGEVS